MLGLALVLTVLRHRLGNLVGSAAVAVLGLVLVLCGIFLRRGPRQLEGPVLELERGRPELVVFVVIGAGATIAGEILLDRDGVDGKSAHIGRATALGTTGPDHLLSMAAGGAPALSCGAAGASEATVAAPIAPSTMLTLP